MNDVRKFSANTLAGSLSRASTVIGLSGLARLAPALVALGGNGCGGAAAGISPEEVSFSVLAGDAKADASAAPAVRARILERPQLEPGRWFEGELRATSNNRGELVVEGGLFALAASSGIRVDLVSTVSSSTGQPSVGIALFSRAQAEHAWRVVDALAFTRAHGDVALYNLYDSVEIARGNLKVTTSGVPAGATRALDSDGVDYALFPVVAELGTELSLRAPYALQLNELP